MHKSFLIYVLHKSHLSGISCWEVIFCLQFQRMYL